MLHIELTPDEQTQLSRLVRESESHRVRQRSQALLWSHQGKKRHEIAALFDVKPDTVTAWFRRWLADPTPDQLRDAFRPGRPASLSPDQKKT
jgi:transposase